MILVTNPVLFVTPATWKQKMQNTQYSSVTHDILKEMPERVTATTYSDNMVAVMRSEENWTIIQDFIVKILKKKQIKLSI